MRDSRYTEFQGTWFDWLKLGGTLALASGGILLAFHVVFSNMELEHGEITVLVTSSAADELTYNGGRIKVLNEEKSNLDNAIPGTVVKVDTYSSGWGKFWGGWPFTTANYAFVREPDEALPENRF